MSTKTTTPEPPQKSQLPDAELPEEIRNAAALANQFNKLNEEWSETGKIQAEARERLDEVLKGTELSLKPNAKQTASWVHLQMVVLAAPEKQRVLGDIIGSMEKTVAAAKSKAASVLNNALAEAARGHQEIAARAIVENFESIKDARAVSEKAKDVREWLDKRIRFTHGDDIKIEAILSRARLVYPELKKLRERLGGNIPSAVEMNKT